MLGEYFLTPDSMADNDGRDGRDVVREMTACFFPSRIAPVALVCSLGGDEWVRATSRRIAQISNPGHRHDAMALFRRVLDECSVSRPPVHIATEDESGWIEAGKKSISQVPLNKIVVSTRSIPPVNIGVSIKEFVLDGFWEDLSNPRPVRRETDSQEPVLRVICTHSDWLLMRLPQIRGGNDDEIVTVKQIIELSNQLPADFRKSHIDLQICLSRNLKVQNLVDNVSSELHSFVQDGVQIQLSIWPEKHFINRYLIGGDNSTTSQGDTVRRPLWWITMSHVAVGPRNGTNAGAAGNTWNLFSRHKAFEEHEKIKKETPLHTVLLTGD